MLSAFWRLVLVQLLTEASAAANKGPGFWWAFTAGIGGIAGNVGTVPSPLFCTLDKLLNYGMAVVEAVGAEEAARLGTLALEEVQAAQPVEAKEVAAARGNSEPASA